MVSSSTAVTEVKQTENRTVQEHSNRWSEVALLACAIQVIFAYLVLRATT